MLFLEMNACADRVVKRDWEEKRQRSLIIVFSMMSLGRLVDM